MFEIYSRDEVGPERRNMYLACYKRMKKLVQDFQAACHKVAVHVTFVIEDALFLSSTKLNETFDVIHTSTLMDFVGILNLLLCCKSRLKE